MIICIALRICIRRTPYIAEEVIQDVFIKYYRMNQFDGRASLKTYLTRVTINCCHDHMRWWKVRTPQFLQPVKKAEQATEKLMLAQVEKDEIIAALFKMPVKYREVIFLCFIHYLTTLTHPNRCLDALFCLTL